MKFLYFDSETFSECDLTTHGTHRYAADPSTEIMMAQWAIDDSEVWIADSTDPADDHRTSFIRKLLTELADMNQHPGVLIVTQNSHFDRTVLRYVWGIDIPVERWYDTMIQAMMHSLPGGLEKIGHVVGLREDEAKHKRGKELIRRFCKPQPKNTKLRRATRETHPEEWAEFKGYGRSDITAMRAAHRKLPTWNYNTDAQRAGGREYRLWCLDQRINDRGFAVDVELARKALATADRAKASLREQVTEATDGAVTSATKRDQLLAYILEEHGVTLPDMRSDTLKRRLEDPNLPEAVKLLIAIRMEAGMSSSSKYTALLNHVSADGRLRNTMQFAGAQRTARWAGRTFQPQNMKRPDPDMPPAVVEALTEATLADVLDLVHGEPMRCLSNIVRGCIVAPKGRKLTIADLSNIEGRKLAWLAGEEWKLQAFREYDEGTGPDLYVLAYARSFNVDPKDVGKGHKRQIGKVQELGLGYQGGVGAFLTFAAVYNMDLAELAKAVRSTVTDQVWAQGKGMYDWTVKKRRSTFGLPEETFIACQVLVTMWREAHPETVALWKEAESAMVKAVQMPGVPFDVGQWVRVQRDGAWTRVRLPSGRVLCYLHVQHDEKGLSYQGINQYTRQWARIRTYGGKLVENWDQASSRDVLAWEMPDIDAAGYEIVLGVHDENVTETPDSPEFTHTALAGMMARPKPWCPGLPLSAAGFETYRYRKD